MKNFETISGGICAAKGFKASGLYCGIKRGFPDGNESPISNSKNDIAMIFADVECNAAGVYTSNKVKGAPVTVTKNNLAKSGGKARAVIVNSGNANTCNADGEEKALEMCRLTADRLNIPQEQVIVASTGVIGVTLPIEPVRYAVPLLAERLSYEGNAEAATAIMTTDTVRKEYAVKFTVGGKECRIGGMAKGSGMIHPNMATTLNFITTDCNLSAQMLQKALSEIVKITYNCLSVDGDQSTNDTCMLISSGLAGNTEIISENEDYEIFKNALYEVMKNLTIMLAKDGEGATKLITCVCGTSPDLDTAITVAKSVIKSPLLKCAMFGGDANWGRILCAVGYAEADFDINKVDVDIASKAGRIAVCRGGAGVSFSEEKAAKILKEDEIEILIELNGGAVSATAWGCDLTYDYVKINGDYRS
ncbi:MAG: bifunctional glutamate N-acetyltransferase/amino-acid acetyltransferase ArgJ [Ruminococcus sp.]|nr:bifunctional glutamate N-acetyltransferase/amino-acid acetyltransferase ArgJ [Ruminococcus sp.]MCM1380949.1 bifunctional glutamate N-acetyltransferase/amino-acid acetyltransferase ArgJ [Muribaculaceae bacterium]MCM1480164.1 bifunctional glutamate N-acetyltransferase/amino-acid acetyltransferase ArgJ [Muribaculaceae bacterium]